MMMQLFSQEKRWFDCELHCWDGPDRVDVGNCVNKQSSLLLGGAVSCLLSRYGPVSVKLKQTGLASYFCLVIFVLFMFVLFCLFCLFFHTTHSI